VSCSGKTNGREVYTVSFETDGGTPVSPERTAELSSAPLTDKEGYAFGGWYFDSDLQAPVKYPLTIGKDMTLYAKWINGVDSRVCEDAAVKFSIDDEYNYRASYIIMPDNLDLNLLTAQGYYIRIDVTYEVYYEKDYNVPFDVGYRGAPDHSVGIVDMYEEGQINEKLATNTEPTEESISLVVSAADIMEKKLFLLLSTENIQNIVYYRNVRVTYTAQRNG
jgi:uncharacterized repeat protein (TIGR02543 family)